MIETSRGSSVFGELAIDSSSVMGVISTPSAAMASSPFCCSGVGCSNILAETSAAMMLRARKRSVARKDEENPRTPVRAATPIATDRTTKKNLPRDERISRAAILMAER